MRTEIICNVLKEKDGACNNTFAYYYKYIFVIVLMYTSKLSIKAI